MIFLVESNEEIIKKSDKELTENYLIENLKDFPLTISILIRLLSEFKNTPSNYNNSQSNNYLYSNSRRLYSTEILINILSGNTTAFNQWNQTSSLDNFKKEDLMVGKKRSFSNVWNIIYFLKKFELSKLKLAPMGLKKNFLIKFLWIWINIYIAFRYRV